MRKKYPIKSVPNPISRFTLSLILCPAAVLIFLTASAGAIFVSTHSARLIDDGASYGSFSV